jgi:hypothetical protein
MNERSEKKSLRERSYLLIRINVVDFQRADGLTAWKYIKKRVARGRVQLLEMRFQGDQLTSFLARSITQPKLGKPKLVFTVTSLPFLKPRRTIGLFLKRQNLHEGRTVKQTESTARES